MSEGTDRVPVPTNGRSPHPPAPAAPGRDRATPGPSSTAEARPTATPGDPRIVVSPTQLAVGFGVIASIVLLVLGRRRRGGPGAS